MPPFPLDSFNTLIVVLPPRNPRTFGSDADRCSATQGLVFFISGVKGNQIPFDPTLATPPLIQWHQEVQLDHFFSKLPLSPYS